MSLIYHAAPPNEQYLSTSEMIERFVEAKAFLQSYDLAPSPPPPPPLSRKYAGPATHRKTEKERQFADGTGEGVGGRGAESYHRKKASSSINHSILSDAPGP